MRDWPPRLIATASIDSDGTILRSAGIESVATPETGVYVITLINPVNSRLHITVQPTVDNRTWSADQAPLPSDQLAVGFNDNDGAPQDVPFSLRVYQD